MLAMVDEKSKEVVEGEKIGTVDGGGAISVSGKGGGVNASGG